MRRMLRLVIVFTLAAMLCANACGQAAWDPVAGNIRSDTEYLCYEIGVRVAGTAEERRTADWIEDRLMDLGCGGYFRESFEGMKGVVSENLGVVLNADPALPLVTVVAHYDTVATSTGARDNSASVAILLEMARYFAENGGIPGLEVRLVFLGSEENGFHGARAYVKGLSDQDRLRHVAAFNMDISCASPSDNARMVMNILGGKNADGLCVDADYLTAFENTVTRYVSAAYDELYGGDVPVLYYGESDHQPFHDAGLEAANICWRRVENNQPVRPESYHTMADIPDDIDYGTAVITGRCVLRAIEMLARDLGK